MDEQSSESLPNLFSRSEDYNEITISGEPVFDIYDDEPVFCVNDEEVSVTSYGDLHRRIDKLQPYHFSQREEDLYNEKEIYGEPVFDIYDDKAIYEDAKECSSILTSYIYDHRDQLVDFGQHIPTFDLGERDTEFSVHHGRDQEKCDELPARDQRENPIRHRLTYYDEIHKDTAEGDCEEYTCYGVYGKDDQGFTEVNQNLRAIPLFRGWVLTKVDLHQSVTASQIKELYMIPPESNLAEGALGKEDSIKCLSSYQILFGYTRFFMSSVTTPDHSRNSLTCFTRKWISHDITAEGLLTPLSFWKFWGCIFLYLKEPNAGLMQILMGL